MEVVPLWYYLKHGGSLAKLDALIKSGGARLIRKSGRAYVEISEAG